MTDLESYPSGDELQAAIEDLQSSVDDLQSTLDALCEAINLNYIYSSNSAIDELLTDLNNACP